MSELIDSQKDLAQVMLKLFAGREGVYARQLTTGAYAPVAEPLNIEKVCQHLEGKTALGVYTVKTDNTTSFLVIDLDDQDLNHVRAAELSIEHFNMKGYVEATGGRGFHIWVFFREAIPAAKALALGKLIIGHADLPKKTEIFPKQKEVKNFGNLIKLPLGIHQRYGKRSHFLDREYKQVPDALSFFKAAILVEVAVVDEILELNYAVPAPDSNKQEDASNYNFDPANMDRIVEDCAYIKELLAGAARGEHIPYPQWRGLCGIYCKFGQEGEKFFHEISKRDSKSYDRAVCQKLIDDYKGSGHKPTSCEYFGCGRDPHKDCGLRAKGTHKQSPIRFGMPPKGDDDFGALEPTPLHLIDIEDSKHAKRLVKTQVMVSALGDTFQVPKRYSVRCYDRESGNQLCRSCSYPNGVIREIDVHDPMLIKLCNKQDEQIYAILLKKAKASVEEKCKLHIRFEQYYSIQEIVLVPKVTLIKEDDEGNVIDETGRDYRHKLVFYVGTLKAADGYFEATGLATPNPNNQLATILVTQMKPLGTDISAFKITEEIKERFKGFQVAEPDIDGLEKKVNEIVKDLTCNVTEIFTKHRELVLFFMLLVYHSILMFNFNGKKINKGWLEMLVIGDPGQGKSVMAESLVKATGLGQLVSGSTATRTGLLYSLDTVENKKRFLRFGVIPMNDGRLVIIDEFQKIPPYQIEELSQTRSSGTTKVDRSIKGEHASRVRLILLANPPSNQSISAETYGIQVCKFERPADNRRLDVVICVSKEDVKPGVDIYKLKEDRERVEQVITGDLLSQSIRWAWSRVSRNVVFERGANTEIMEQATFLNNKYDVADIPVVSTDTHDKLARWSVALAALVHSTDESHEKVIVKREHVLFVAQKIQEAYDHPNCALDKYAASIKAGNELDDQEYDEICDEVAKINYNERYSKGMSRLLKVILHNDMISNAEIGARLDIGVKAVRERVRVLLNHDLVVSTSKGFKKTNKGTLFLRRYFELALIKDVADAKGTGSTVTPNDDLFGKDVADVKGTGLEDTQKSSFGLKEPLDAEDRGGEDTLDNASGSEGTKDAEETV